MFALRLASLGAAALSFALSLSTCGGSTESGAGPEPQKQVPAADVELPGVDTSSLTPRERREWSSYVSEQLAPCKDTPVPIGQCVREKRACKRCQPAARFLVAQVRNGGAREQVLEAYRSRFDNDRVKNIDVGDAPMKGAATAPVTLVEWADFQCPFCKSAAPVIDELVSRYPGKVRVYFKNYPLQAHALAEPAARAAIAAEAQGKFWEMHHKLFESNAAGLEPRGIETHARELGLKLDRFKADMESDATTARIAREKKQAETLGFSGTPLIYINGREFPLRGDFATELNQWVKLELELLDDPAQPVVPQAPPSAASGAPKKAPPPLLSPPSSTCPVKSTTDGCGCFPTGRHYPGIAHLLRVHVAGVADELAADAPWEGQRIAFLDTETTGRDSATDRILEVGIIIGEGGRVVERHNWLVNPGGPIPEASSKIHGITDDDVRDKPPLAAIAPEIVAALRGAIPAAYNASFDRAFLRAEMARAGALAPAAGTRAPPALREGVEWIDPLVWARLLQREERSKTLSEVAARLGIKLENAHRASDDAEAALLVMYALGRDERVPRTYGQMIREQRRLARMQEEDFAKWRR